MKTSTFAANLAVWAVIGAVAGGFLIWLYTGDVSATQAVVNSSTAGLVGSILSVPALLYAAGVVVGLLVVKFARIQMARNLRSNFFIIASLVIFLMIAAVIPVFALGSGAGAAATTIIVVYATAYAPVIFPAAGVLYALALAPIKQAPRPVAAPKSASASSGAKRKSKSKKKRKHH